MKTVNRMKKIIMIAAASLFGVSSAYASGYVFDDGSPVNNYVIGSTAQSGVNHNFTGNSRAYTRANGFGGGSVEDSYVIGHAQKSGAATHGVSMNEAHFGDGSPVNHH